MLGCERFHVYTLCIHSVPPMPPFALFSVDSASFCMIVPYFFFISIGLYL
jgi:hypothetical protein